VVADNRVSRNHAIIHSRSEGEFWLVDLGSRNGTYLNDRRVHQPVRLRDGDLLRIGGSNFAFRQPGAEAGTEATARSTAKTLSELHPKECWLLVADVVGSTQLAKNAPPEEVAVLIGKWFLLCKQLIELADGTMNKCLGDGFLAFWPADTVALDSIVKVLGHLRQLQETRSPRFRLVLHYGKVFLGGGASLGEESLSGPEVNFVFRMEKLAGNLGTDCLFSEAAQIRLCNHVQITLQGTHSVAGFDGEFEFFAP